jgi:hypothetical protein
MHILYIYINLYTYDLDDCHSSKGTARERERSKNSRRVEKNKRIEVRDIVFGGWEKESMTLLESLQAPPSCTFVRNSVKINTLKF